MKNENGVSGSEIMKGAALLMYGRPDFPESCLSKVVVCTSFIKNKEQQKSGDDECVGLLLLSLQR